MISIYSLNRLRAAEWLATIAVSCTLLLAETPSASAQPSAEPAAPADGAPDSDAQSDQDVPEAQNELAESAVVEQSDGPQEVSKSLAQSWQIVRTRLWNLWYEFLKNLPEIVASILIIGLTWILAKIASYTVRQALSRSNLRTSLKDLFRQIVLISVWVIGILTAAVVLFPGMTPARILTVLGLSSVAVGFAFKDIFENFFAGVLILWRFPFESGDFIECGEVKGKVVDVEIRMTRLRTTTGVLIVVPNAKMFKEPVHILTSQSIRRTTIICGVAYHEDVDKCREIIHKAVRKCDSVSQERDIEIFAQEFASSSINFEVTWWTGSTPLQVRKSRDQVVAAVKRALDEAKVEIPFPYRTLTFNQPLTMRSEVDTPPATPSNN